jgi:hypothetical protein
VRPPVPLPNGLGFRDVLSSEVPTHGTAVHLTTCPRSGCQRPPLPIFCVDDWPKVSSATRQALVKQWKRLTGAGTKTPPRRFVELLGIAVKEIGRAK